MEKKMTIKELFRKVENINKTKKELGLGDEEVQIEVEFGKCDEVTFSSFNQLYAHVDMIYLEEYKEKFMNAELVKEYNYFKMYFNSLGEQQEVVVFIYNY